MELFLSDFYAFLEDDGEFLLDATSSYLMIFLESMICCKLFGCALWLTFDISLLLFSDGNYSKGLTTLF